MNLAFRIKERREELGLSRSELAKLLGVTVNSISNYENGVSSPKEPILFKMIDSLKCDANYLFQDSMKSTNFDVTYSEFENIIKKYRSLDQYSQETVSLILDREVERSKIKENVEYEVEIDNIIQLTSTEIGITGIASAGGGTVSFDKERPIKIVTVGYAPPQYDYAFEVSGDSMLPAFRDREIVFVRETPNLYSGMLAVVEINHEVFFKKIYLDDGRMRLISLNDDVDAHGNRIYPDFFADERDEIHIIGKVIN